MFSFNGQTYSVDDPHNSYVWLLTDGGILTLFGFLLLVAASVVGYGLALRRAGGLERTILWWSGGTLAIVLIDAFTEPVFSVTDFALLLWTLLLMPAALARSRASAVTTPLAAPASPGPLL
jgi:hypothetical protein